MTEDQKNWIDNASHYTLLSKWRFSPSGDPMFEGDTGEYYKKVMGEKKNADPAGAVADSKAMGW